MCIVRVLIALHSVASCAINSLPARTGWSYSLAGIVVNRLSHTCIGSSTLLQQHRQSTVSARTASTTFSTIGPALLRFFGIKTQAGSIRGFGAAAAHLSSKEGCSGSNETSDKDRSLYATQNHAQYSDVGSTPLSSLPMRFSHRLLHVSSYELAMHEKPSPPVTSSMRSYILQLARHG